MLILRYRTFRARVAPGIRTRRHRLRDVTGRHVIIAGTGSVEAGPLTPRQVDAVLIPSPSPQCITNTGAEDLVFPAICTSRFCWENYEDIAE